MMKMKKEENAIVIDYLKRGYPNSYKKKPIVQAIGTDYFTLLELVPEKDQKISLGEKLYVGEDEREKIKYIKSTLDYKDLTNTAKNELENVVDTLIEENKDKFVKFFNQAKPITIKEHSLELLPGIGKKHMKKVLETREKQEFESFKDLKERVDLMPDPKKILKERLLNELRGDTKYYLFVQYKRKNKKKGRKR